MINMVSFQGRIFVHVSIKGPIKRSQHLSAQHGPTFVVVTMYRARSNGHNNLTIFQEQNKHSYLRSLIEGNFRGMVRNTKWLFGDRKLIF